MINGERPLWQSRAACALSDDVQLADFYVTFDNPNQPKDKQAQHVEKLRRVCNTCPVIPECRAWADETSPGWGFFANETPRERRNRRRSGKNTPTRRALL